MEEEGADLCLITLIPTKAATSSQGDLANIWIVFTGDIQFYENENVLCDCCVLG